MAHETTVTVRSNGKGKFTQDVNASGHSFTGDEPEDLGGLDEGPSPYDLLLAALGTCTSMTLRMYADQKKWDLQEVAVTLTHRKEAGPDGKKVDVITRDIAVTGNLDEAQRQRLLEIADRCPVHRTLESKPTIVSSIAAAPAGKGPEGGKPAAPPQKPPQA
ncbi:MAG: OsmC family peroxiredoxin [Alphaproteobacteria bacterium]|nr:OsmC family peroxiredoxin [Alphaproteobacteria bacterium]